MGLREKNIGGRGKVAVEIVKKESFRGPHQRVGMWKKRV